MSGSCDKSTTRRKIDHNALSEDDGDDSDTLTELSRESLTSSQGRSSIGSIPWAEDAIKQNQLEWERIDRMFYGEEDLPSDPKLRDEIIEWTSVFPFLRLMGKSIRIEESANVKGNDPFHEEIFLVDPPPVSRTRSSRSGNDGTNKHVAKDIDCDLTCCELDKCLYISSGSAIRQNNQPTQAKNGRRYKTDLVSEYIDKVEKPFIKVKPLNSLMVPQVPIVPIRSYGLIISNHCVGAGGYQPLLTSRNCSAQSVSHLGYTVDGLGYGGHSRNGNLQRKLAPLPHRPQQQQMQQNKSSKTIETTVLSASASATHNRVPPLTKNYKFLVQNSRVAPTLLAEIEQRHHTKLNVVKSATTRYMPSSPTKHIFALPSLAGIHGLTHHSGASGGTVTQRSPNKKVQEDKSPKKKRVFRSEVIGRSISAAVTQKGNPI